MHRHKRILVLTCLVVSGTLALVLGQQRSTVEPVVVDWNRGEILLDAQGRTNSINVSPATGSPDLALVTQDMPPGSSIRVHRHDRTEEILFVHRGSGTLILGDRRVQVQEGTTIYVPKGTWHGMENPSGNMRIVAVATPPGLDGFFRGMFWRPGEQPKQLTPEQIQSIELKYDAISRPN